MAAKSSFNRLKLYSFKLNALLEITKAINENLSVEELLGRYKSILTDELSIGKIAIIKLTDQWDTILTSGLKNKELSGVNVEKDLLHNAQSHCSDYLSLGYRDKA